jgi:hypothetical protein
MKKILRVAAILLLAISSQVSAKTINVCTIYKAESSIKYELVCDIGGRTTLEELYEQGWRLITVSNTHWVSSGNSRYLAGIQYFLEK